MDTKLGEHLHYRTAGVFVCTTSKLVCRSKVCTPADGEHHAWQFSRVFFAPPGEGGGGGLALTVFDFSELLAESKLLGTG